MYYGRWVCIIVHPALVLFEQSNCIAWINFCYIWSLYIAFVVPDSCRATVRNDNNISADVIEDTIEND